MHIAIGCDHAGFELKQCLVTLLRELGHYVSDFGIHTYWPADYPDFAEKVGLAVRSGQVLRGIVICGSGVGASISANKIAGIRAGLCHDTYSAQQGVEHEDMNVLVLGARVIGIETARIRELIGAGINVNVTLLFSKAAYEQVAEAYIGGLEKLASAGGDVSKVASVASFFISRIDSALDAMLVTRIKSSSDAREGALLESLVGKVAVANAKLTYRRYQELFSGARWRELAKQGAQTQRVLWASTSTKNPGYRDVIYVEELVGRDTVNTIPPATFDAFRDHGRVRLSLTEDVESAHDTMETLGRVGISMAEVTDRLLEDGLALFSEAFEKLLGAVDPNCKSTGEVRHLSDDLTAGLSVLDAAVKEALA